MEEYWTNFVYRGNPNDAVTAVTWPTYNATTRHNMKFVAPTVMVETGYRYNFCNMWDAAVKNITAHPAPAPSAFSKYE